MCGHLPDKKSSDELVASHNCHTKKVTCAVPSHADDDGDVADNDGDLHNNDRHNDPFIMWLRGFMPIVIMLSHLPNNTKRQMRWCLGIIAKQKTYIGGFSKC